MRLVEGYQANLIHSLNFSIIQPTGMYADKISKSGIQEFTHEFKSKEWIKNSNSSIYFWRFDSHHANLYYNYIHGLKQLMLMIKNYMPDLSTYDDYDDYFLYWAIFYHCKQHKEYLSSVLFLRLMNKTFFLGCPSHVKFDKMYKWESILKSLQPLIELSEPPIHEKIPVVEDLF